jgi:hypothetical protein
MGRRLYRLNCVSTLTILFLIPLLTMAFIESNEEYSFNEKYRQLQNYGGCDQVIGTISPDEVRSLGRMFLSNFIFDSDILDRTTEVIFLSLKYDLTVKRLCASCQDHANWYIERGILFPGYHAKYCNESDAIAFSTPISMLVFLPQYNANSTDLPPKIKLRTFLTMPPTLIKDDGSLSAPSADFSSQWFSSGNITSVDRDFFSIYLPGLTAASAGAVSLFPDYPGANTRNSEPLLLNRSFFRRRSYEQASAVSYLALQRYVVDTSRGCTLLDNSVTIYGNDADAAFAATYATITLQRFGITCLTAFLSTGMLDLPLFLQDAISSSSTSLSPPILERNKWILLTAYTMAFNNDVSSNVQWLSDSYRASLRQMYDSVSTDTSNTNTTLTNTTALPSNPIEVFHPSVIAALQVYNSTDWEINQRDLTCNISKSTNVTDSVALAYQYTGVNNSTLYTEVICQMRQQYSANTLLMGKTDRYWISNISSCYSNGDEIVNGTIQYENPTLLQDVKLVDYWKRYTHPTGLDALNLIGKDHATAVQLCTVAPLLFFTLDGHRPVNVEEWGNFAPTMTTEELSQCYLPPVSADSSSTGSPQAVPEPSSSSATSPNNSPVAESAPSVQNAGNAAAISPSTPTSIIANPESPSVGSKNSISTSDNLKGNDTSGTEEIAIKAWIRLLGPICLQVVTLFCTFGA